MNKKRHDYYAYYSIHSVETYFYGVLGHLRQCQVKMFILVKMVFSPFFDFFYARARSIFARARGFLRAHQ